MKPELYTKTATDVRDASVALWYAVVFCGSFPPSDKGGPEDWHKLDSDRALIGRALEVLAVSDALGMTECTRVDWRYYVRQYKRAVDRCISANMPLVYQVTRKWVGTAERRGLSKEDLVQEGVLGLMRAVQKFEPDKGFQFSTYAFPWIYMMITRSINVYSMIHTPIDSSRKVSEELAEKVKNAHRMDSLNREVSNTQASSFGALVSLQDTVPSSVLTPEEALAVKQDSDNLQNAMKSELTPRELDILHKRFYDELTLMEIGELYASQGQKGNTRERIRQIESAALGKLRSYMDPEEANFLDLEIL